MNNQNNTNKTSSNDQSPCVNICQLNDQDICVGCGRSIQEIINWNEIVLDERAQEVREKAKKRLEEMS